jgi:ribulokinase
MSDYFLTCDFGTESLRGALFDERGEMLCTAARPYRTIFERPGWAEQVPDEWWTACIEVVRTLLKESGVSPDRIPAVCIDTTSCTVVALDGRFRPLRNALLWMDVRAFRQAERIAESGADALAYNGYGSVSAEWMPSKALWLKENEPEVYEGARYVCELQDYINYRLTGRYVGSINNVTIRWYYHARRGGWPDLYEKMGIGDVVPKFPGEILKMGEPIGTLLPDVARDTGLSEKTLVIQGGADAFTGMIGLGVVKPGRVALITGSSHVMLGLSEKEFHKKGVFGSFPESVVPGMDAVEGSQISTGSVLRWFKDRFICREFEEAAAEKGLDLYTHMNDLARELPVGSEGLIVLNYWQGNRNPVTDSQARGVMWGFSLNHTPVHVYRAILEGVAYGTEYIVRHFREAGFEPDGIYVCGGATKSDLWMQIHSDVIGLPIHLIEEENAPLLGDAVLATCGAGVYPRIEDAVEKMVKIEKTIEPEAERHRAYRFYVDSYAETYGRLRDLMHEMVAHECG